MNQVLTTEQETGTWYALQLKEIPHRVDDMDAWCTDMLGQGITGMKDSPNMTSLRGDECRWGMFYGNIFFRYKEDMLMFMLRWS